MFHAHVISLKLRPCPRSRFANCKVNAWSSKFAMSMTTSRITALRWRKRDHPGGYPRVEDLHKLPFLTKSDLRDAYPYGLLATPLQDCVRIQSTSGTTGRRVVAFYTQHDVDLWEDCCARAIMAAGGTAEDVSMSPMAMVCSPAVPVCMAAPTRWAA